MTNDQLREYCDAEFENIDTVKAELWSVIRPEKSEYSIAELAAIATFIHNIYNGIENILKRVFRANQIKIINLFLLLAPLALFQSILKFLIAGV